MPGPPNLIEIARQKVSSIRSHQALYERTLRLTTMAAMYMGAVSYTHLTLPTNREV